MHRKSLLTKLREIVRLVGGGHICPEVEQRLRSAEPGAQFWVVVNQLAVVIFATKGESTVIDLGWLRGRQEFLCLGEFAKVLHGRPSVVFHVTVGERGMGLVRGRRLGQGWLTPRDLFDIDAGYRNRMLAQLRNDLRRARAA